jgi:glycine/D-amino acid oxidase-like deaminating enzyme/nitrite reductase/ring-hydroxylating ferredoxin subunit
MPEHSSVWLAGLDQVSYPGLDGDLVVDVAVVGGGIAGLTTALLVQRSGMRVAVIEADRIGAGTTGHTTGKVTSQHTLIYRQLVQKHGEHRAQLYADANQAAIEMIATLADETEADCQFERAPAYVYTLSPDERGAIETEHEAAVGLGLPAMLTTDVDLPFPVEVALRFDHQAHFHASRYTAALARSFAARGGHVFEHTRATRVVERSDHAIVQTPHGEVRAARVVLTTLLPFVDLTGFFAKARASRAYGVAARLRGEAPTGMHINVESPTRSTRPWVEGNRPGLIVVGETHPTGDEEAVPGRWGELERWTRQHFDVESFDHRWSAQDYTTADHIPYVGRSPRMARTFVATGFNKWGLSNGTAAAMVLADLVAGHPNPWLEAFDATRIGDAQTIKRLIEENLHVAKRFLGDRLARRRVGSAAELEPGEGGMVKVRGDTVGAYRDPDGALHAVSITCTHMGCTLHWNAAETTWDCPCHGSRFSHEGDVLNGPAVRPLERKDGVADQ